MGDSILKILMTLSMFTMRVMPAILFLLRISLLVVGVIIISLIWFRFGPKLSNGEAIYPRTMPVFIMLFMQYLVIGVITKDVVGEVGAYLIGLLLFASVWGCMVLIQFCRHRKVIYAPYRSFWEHFIQSSAHLKSVFPFPILYPKYNAASQCCICILNPLAWYDYLLWKLVNIPIPELKNPDRSIVFIKHLGKALVTAPELVARDYPNPVSGKRICILHEGDVIDVYQTNALGWVGFIYNHTSPLGVECSYQCYVMEQYVELGE